MYSDADHLILITNQARLRATIAVCTQVALQHILPIHYIIYWTWVMTEEVFRIGETW